MTLVKRRRRRFVRLGPLCSRGKCICIEFAGVEVPPDTPYALPPYHDGCDCTTVPEHRKEGR